MKETFLQSMDIRISFFVRSSYQNKEGKFPIILRIIYRGQRRDIFTGLYCFPESWNSKEDCVMGSGREIHEINQHLGRIQYKVRDCYDELKFSGKTFTIDELVAKVKGKEAPPQTLLEFANLRIEDYKKMVGFEIAQTTFFKYNRAVTYLGEFLREERKVENIALCNVNGDFLHQFFRYLRMNKKNSHNTSLSLMKCFRTILNSAIKSRVIETNPFEDFRVGFKDVHRDCLTKQEIEKLASLEITSKMLDGCRDYFLLACYTGLAYSDIKSLSREHIQTDNEGAYYIKKARNKTTALSLIPLIEPALRILCKHSPTGNPRDFIFKVPCNQVMNRYLKEIGKAAGIEKKLFMHLARHTFATTVTLSNGVPIETVSKMLGHTSLKHTVRYAKVVQEKIKDEMSKVRDIFR